MIHELATSLLWDKPLVMYGGILTGLLILFTATVGLLNHQGISVIPFKWHPRLAILAIILMLGHAFFGLSIYFNY